MATQISSISQALAGNCDALSIPKPPSILDGAKPAAVGIAGAHTNTAGLPTPPNSISPNLPPHAFKAKLARESAQSPPDHFDSDIDLQDAVDHAQHHSKAQGYMTREDGGAEGVGIITPAYLAKNHLGDIVLEKGPIAIRHVMNHLCQAVPGFVDIPPAKARRIVVAALESRNGGGHSGEVEFEKVGWGRWDAKVRGQPQKDGRGMYSIREGNRWLNDANNTASPSSSNALRIPGNGSQRRPLRRVSHGSWTAESIMSFRGEHADRMDTDVAGHEADKMSIDSDEEQGHGTRSQSRHRKQQWYSDTDEEDWSQVSAAALGQGSYPSKAGSWKGGYFTTSLRPGNGRSSFSRSPYARTMPPVHNLHSRYHQHRHPSHPAQNRQRIDVSQLDFSGVDADSQEREAIQALLQMGSM